MPSVAQLERQYETAQARLKYCGYAKCTKKALLADIRQQIGRARRRKARRRGRLLIVDPADCARRAKPPGL